MEKPNNWPNTQEGRDAWLAIKELRLAGASMAVYRGELWVEGSLCGILVDWVGGVWQLRGAHSGRFPFPERHQVYKTWKGAQKAIERFLGNPQRFEAKELARWPIRR